MTEAQLVPVLQVNDDGSVSDALTMSSSDNDITGGIESKMKAAINIVRTSGGRVGLLLCSISGNAFKDACVHGRWQADSIGTVIFLRQ